MSKESRYEAYEDRSTVLGGRKRSERYGKDYDESSDEDSEYSDEDIEVREEMKYKMEDPNSYVSGFNSLAFHRCLLSVRNINKAKKAEGAKK